jgi:copper resistance protein D
VQLFIEIYGFLNVTLRGFILTAQSLTLGGLAFLLLPAVAEARLGETGRRRAEKLIFWSALALCAGEALAAAALGFMLSGTLGLSAGEFLGAEAVKIDLLASVLAGAAAFFIRSRRDAAPAAALAGVFLLATQIGATHAASRLDHAYGLYVAEFAHMLGVAIWIGGIPYFLIALGAAQAGSRRYVVTRFSMISAAGVAMLLGAGVYMAADYLGEPQALYGASYGVMLTAKAGLLLGLLLLGGMNFLTGRELRSDPRGSVSRLRRFAEVEIGVGLTALFCAASLTSLPPARDLPNDRASWNEVVERVEPRWPIRLDSPDHASLSTSQPRVADPNAPRAYAMGETVAPPRNAEDIAWSEYNHHWAGIFVLLMGLLALAEHDRRLAPIAKHWPLTFLGLAGFLFLRADEEVWPLGHLGLIESLRDPEIAQHRLMIVLIILFGLFEWRVRLGRLKAAWAPYVFPLTTAVAAGFLLTHSHGLANPKEEMLIEITHTPLALVGVAAGWARWLELRLDDGPARRIASLVWPIAFILAGLLLMFYREA